MPCFFNDSLCFLHIPKCGGLSVTAAARKHLPGYTEPGLARKWHEPGKPIGHIRAEDFEAFTGRSLNSFVTVFATIREPVACEWSKWSFWRARYYKDGNQVAWRHPADAWCWQHSFEEYVEKQVEPFNEWYADKIAPWAERNYNAIGRFKWWLHPKVEAIDITNSERINEILSKFCKQDIRIEHLHKTGAGTPKMDKHKRRQIGAWYAYDAS